MKETVEVAAREALLEETWEVAERVIASWPLDRPVVQLLEHKKNTTFRVDAADGRYVLRVCDPDGYGEAEVRSELQYLEALREATGLLAPRPVRTRDGALVVQAAAGLGEAPRRCALFRWVPGRMVQDTPTPRRLERIGEISARLHRFAESWQPPAGFTRPRWDAAGLFGSGPVLAPGQGEPLVGERARALVEEAAGVVRETMAGLGEGRDVFGLIHKDLEPDNTLVEPDADGERVHPIDFADLGWGHYLYDIAAALLPLREKPGFAGMLDAFLRGYRRGRPLAAEHAALLPTFLIARSIFSVRLMTGRLWDLPHIRDYAATAVPQILGGIRVFLERRAAASTATVPGAPGATTVAAATGSTRTTVQILALLRDRGVKLWAEGEKLRYSAPPGALTAELLAEIKQRKAELLGFLRQGQAARRAGAPAQIAAARRARAPLSFAQQRLWFLHQLAPESVEYNIARAVRLRGRVRVELLAASLRLVVRRHGALRTAIVPSAAGDPAAAIGAADAIATSAPTDPAAPADLAASGAPAAPTASGVPGAAADSGSPGAPGDPGTLHGEPVQVVAPEMELGLPVVELSALPAARREAEAWRLAQADARRAFDLARRPLLRVFLARLDAEDWIAPSTMHHVIGDGWSSGILFREMGLFYGALARGTAPALPALPVQYTDYAVWQREWLSGEVLAEQLGWWREELAGAPQELALPTDRPRSAAVGAAGAAGSRGDRRPLLVPRPLADALKAFSQAQGATLFMILLAAWQTLLCRLGGQDDLVVGSPIANRNRAEIEGLIGCFVNTLALRAVFRGNPAFREVLAAVRRTTLGAYAHQDLPFEKLVEELRPERSLAQTPLFQVIFTLQNVPSPDMEAADFRMTLMPPTSRAAAFDLALNMKETPEGVSTSFLFKEDLFDGATVERLAAGYLRLLATVAADPDQRLRELPLLSPAEVRQLLAWGGVRAVHAVAEDETLAALFAARARQAPDAVALTCEGSALTYAELSSRAGRLAGRLRRLGAGPEERVGLCAGRSPELVIGMLAIVKAGGAYVPLDPAYPRERLALLIDDAGLRVAVGTAEALAALPAAAPVRRVVIGAHGAIDDAIGATDAEGAGAATAATDPNAANAAYVIYTSGSTGRPKGAVVTHANVVRLLRATAEDFGFGPDDVWTLFHSFAFDFSVWEIWGALLTGGRLVVVPFAVSRSPRELHALLAGERVTVLNQTPTAFAELMRADEELARTDAEPVRAEEELTQAGEERMQAGEGQMRADEEQARAGALSPLRLVIFGGEALAPSVLAPWLARHGDRRPRLVNMYGITETTVHVTVRPLAAADAHRHESLIGVPLADLAVHVLDAAGQPAPIGVPGELAVGGAGLARGYLGLPALTAERFVPDPWAGNGSKGGKGGIGGIGAQPGARLYRSGDLGRFLPAGELEYLGRIDQQLKIRGFRIEPGEVEAALAAHPDVRQAVVLPLQGGPLGARLAAFVVPHGEPPRPAELRARAAAVLPEHLVPAAFHLLEALPLTTNGKVDRRALAALAETAAAAAPNAAAFASDTAEGGRAAPQGPVEELLAGIFAEVLGAKGAKAAGGADGIGARTDFFAAGGHSLLATQVVSRVRQALGVELPLRSLFAHPVLADLAREIEALRRAGEGAALPAVRRAPDRGATAPLSFAQERMWFLHRLAPGRDTYNVAVNLLLAGDLRPAAAARALGEVVRRHEVLRTTIAPGDSGPPLQRVAPAASPRRLPLLPLLQLPLCDLSRLPEERREAERRRLAAAEASRPFDLAAGPVLRALLIRLGAERHAATLTLHHIATDGWSTGILVREFCALYSSFVRAQPSPLPELPVQYADYAIWQRRWLAGPALDRQLAWWRQRLGFDPPPLDLPADRPRLRDRAWGGAVHRFAVEAELSAALQRLGRRRSATLFMTLLAAWKALLGRLSGEEVIRVGTPVAGRRSVEVEGLIGLFVNTLVLSTEVTGESDGAPSFAGLLDRVRETSLAAHAHQDAPFDRLVDELVRERDLSRPPLFQVLFALQNAPGAAADLPGLRVTLLPGGARGAMFDLALQIDPEASGLAAQLDYSTDLYDAATVERLAGHFTTLLAAAAAAPETAVTELPLLAPAERRQLLAWGSVRQEYEAEATLAELFAAQVRRSPGATAVRWEGEGLTYAELDGWAGRLARRLRSVGVGVGPEERVGLCAERSPALVAGMLAIVQAGGAYLPLDPAYPRERLAFLIADAGVRVVVGTAAALAQLPADGLTVCPIDPADRDPGPAAPAPRPAGAASPQNTAYVIYTSGSTGRPKGVAVTHANVVRLLAATDEWFGFGPADVWTFFHSFAFDFSVWEIWGALLTGGCLVVVPHEVSRTPAAFHQLLTAEGVTVLNQTPTAFAGLMRADEEAARAGGPSASHPLRTLRSLRLVILGGESLAPSRLLPWFERHGDESPRVINLYGITETTVVVTYRPLTAADARSASGSLIGVPIPDLAAHVLEPGAAREPAPAGVAGELAIGGAGLAPGYHGRPDLTAERFVPDHLSGRPGERLYRSGDLARWLPSGELEYLGRMDHQVKIRGFRIELGEIEAALVALPGVRQAVVLAEAQPAAEGGGRLAAFVVPRPGWTLRGAELRQLLAAALPEPLLPSVFVTLDALPATANGKVDRRALLARSAAALPEEPEAAGFAAPRDPAEEILAGIFAEVLGRERVGTEAHFFALGGNSLLALQVASRVRRALGVELPLRLLFEEPTVGGLAAQLRALDAGGEAEAWAPIPRCDLDGLDDQDGQGGEDGAAPLSFAQERLWLLDQMAPGSPLYNVPGSLLLTGPLDVAALAAAFAAVVRRHDGLRTVFRAPAGVPFQIVLPPAAVLSATPPIPIIDLDGLAVAARETEAARQQSAEALRSFDLAAGPLYRVRLLRLAAERHLLLLTFHHIVFDGWSVGILARELSALYAAGIADSAGIAGIAGGADRTGDAGRPAPLPELPVRYTDYARWQRARFTGATLERFLGYWRRLSGVPPLRLPLDRPRRPAGSYSGGGEPLALGPATGDAVRRLARQRAATPFMVGLAAFAALLHRASGQSDFAVGTWVANRARPELEGLIGFFVNNLALRLDVEGSAGAATFGDLLEQVRDVALGAYAHQELPFEKLIEDLELPRDPGVPPVFQAVCVQAPPAGRLELAGVSLAIGTAAGDRAHVDLTLDLAAPGDPSDASHPAHPAGPAGSAGAAGSTQPTAGAWGGTLIYNRELFDRATAIRLSRACGNLLAAALADTDQAALPVAELPLLSAAESWQIAGEWSRALPSPFLAGGGRAAGIDFVHQLVERQAALRPEAEAVAWAGSPAGERLTYGALNARANRLARLLRRHGAAPEVRVALWLPRSVDAVVALLAVLKAGACYVPLDTAWSGERLAFMATDARARIVVLRDAPSLAPGMAPGMAPGAPPAGGAAVLRLDDPAVAAALAAESAADLPPREVGLDPDNLASVIYTSGSTGRPKGTMTAHRGLLDAWYAWDLDYRLGATTAHLQVASFSFDVFTEDLLRALGAGARLVLCPREDLLDPARLHARLAAERIDALELVPAVARTLAGHLGRTGGRLDALRLLVVGADAWHAADATAMARLCGPETRLVNSYGVTEVTIDSTFLPLAAGDGTPPLALPATAAMVPVGRPHAGGEAWVLGPGGVLAPPRLPGELCLGGSGVGRGYLDRPALTAERFVPHPHSAVPGARLYRTGDLARRLAGGDIELLGRADSQIKVRGFRIEPGEIEAALLAEPGVAAAAVAAQGDGPARRLVAYLVPRAGAAPAERGRRERLRAALPDYMVPAAFVVLERLPLTPNGKLDRAALPAVEEAAQPAAHTPPQGPVEELLAGSFAEVLRTGATDPIGALDPIDAVGATHAPGATHAIGATHAMGAESHFFALGGHSLLAAQVAARLRQALGIEVPLRLLFEAPTVAQLARAVEELRRGGGEAPPPPVTRSASRAPVSPGAPGAGSAGEGAAAPLSFAQERMWFLHRFAPQSDAYNIALPLALDGGLDRGAAARALTEIVRRHEVLRTVIAEGPGGGPVQVVRPLAAVALPLCDLAALPAARREAEASRLTAAAEALPLDLAHGPVLRVVLVRLAERRHTAVLAIHHVATDGWSMSILVRELCALYGALVRGAAPALAELPVQYADYAVWQRRWLGGAALDGQLAWWRQRLGVDPPPLDLPADRPRSAARAWGGAVRRFVLAPPPLAARVHRFSRQRTVSLFMSLLAAWQALLARLSGQDEVRVGTPVSNRPGVEVEGLIGLFLNTLVLATDTGGSPPFAALAGRVRETCLAAHAHQDAPFDRLVEELVRERDLSRSPLFQVLFVVQNMPEATAELPDLRLTQLPGGARAAKFDLSLQLTETAAGLAAQLDYSTDLFDAATIERLAQAYQTLLAAAVADPERPADELPLLTLGAAQQVLREWNDAAGGGLDDSPATTLTALFTDRVRRSPGAPALTTDGLTLTYGELDARANRLAHHLLALGVGPEVRVGLAADRSLAMAVGLLATLKAGGAYVPLDPAHPRERLAFLLDDAEVQVVAGETGALARIPVPAAGTAIDAAGDWSRYPDTAPAERAVPADPDNVAYVIYTSGSTGRPKGVLVTHGSAARYALWSAAAYGVAAHAGSCVHTSPAFDLTVTSLLTPLLAGVPVHLVPEGAELDGLARAVAATGYGFVKLTPAHLELLRGEAAAFAAAAPLTLVVGGEALHGAALRGWPAGARIVNEYGPTEATVGCAAFALPAASGWKGPVPIGRPIAGARLHVLSAATPASQGAPAMPAMVPLPAGAAGELWIGGPGLARGYLRRPDLTAERFLPDPFAPGERLYRTGDRVRWRTDGQLEYLGRLDGQVKVRGFRIEPGEVEAALAALPGVESAVVLVRESDGQRRLVAWVVGPAGGDGEGLRRQLLARLPEPMVPAAFVPLAALPLTANGKVDRGALPEPETAAQASAAARHVAPRNRTEELLAEVWLQVLGKQRTGGQIGVHDNFFQLGGDSIQSLQVVSRAARAGLRVTARLLFKHPTIAELALVAVPAVPKEGRTAGAPAPPAGTAAAASSALPAGPLSIAEVVGRLAPLTPIQERFFAASLPHAEQHNQALLLAARDGTAALSPALLRQAIGHLWRHHDALRLRFLPPTVDAPRWRQAAAPPEGAPPLLHADLSALPEAAHHRALEASAGALQASLDLVRGPVLRAVLYTTGASGVGRANGVGGTGGANAASGTGGAGAAGPGHREDRLLLILHHLVIDGVSWRILAEDLEETYRRLERGEAVELPPPATSFLQWAERLHAHAGSAAAQAAAAWWLERPPPRERLPVDAADGTGAGTVPTVASLRSAEVRLTADETRALLAEAPRAYRTQVNDLLLTALVEAFAPWIGSRRLLVDLEGHGREELPADGVDSPEAADVDLSRTVGWFTSLFPVALDLTGIEAPGAALKAVKEQLRAVPGRGLGFGVVRWLGRSETAERLGALPAPEVAFNYLGQIAAGGEGGRLFRLAGEAAGATRHPAQPLPHLLEIHGGVTGGQLWMQFGYSAARHLPATVERLAERFAGRLRALVAHCLEPGAGGFTPSDFPLARLDAAALDRLLADPADAADVPPVEDMYPLSPLQQGMLFHALQAPGSGAYVVQMSVRLGAGFDPAALARSWQEVAGRHPILRTSFRWLGLDEPLQVVHAPFPLRWERHDWSGLPAAAQAARLAEHLRQDRRRGFDLAAAPLLRLALIRLGPGEGGDGEHPANGAGGADGGAWQLIWTHHHAILDGWSLPIVLRELFSCYAAALRGTAAALPPVRPFRDYIAWLRRQDWSAAEAFWRAELAGFTAPTPLPGGSRRQGDDGGLVKEVRLSAATSAALGELARRHRLTQNTLAQGAWALLLARHCGEDDVVFGAVTAGRGAPLAGIDAMVGLFVNTLPVRARVPQGMPAVPWLRRLQESQAAARQFEHAPLGRVRAWSGLPAGAPLFESILAFENYPLEEALHGDARLAVAIAGVEGTEQTHYPLTVNVQPGTRWALRLAAADPRLDAVSLARLAGHLANLLSALADEGAATGLPAAELPLLAPAEGQQLLVELPALPDGADERGGPARQGAPDPQGAAPTLTARFAQRARRSPWQVAVVCQGVPLTYAELDQRSARLAGFLRRAGVGPEVRVGLAVEPSLDRVVGLLGILRAGGAAVPLDPGAGAPQAATARRGHQSHGGQGDPSQQGGRGSPGDQESQDVQAARVPSEIQAVLAARVALVLTLEHWRSGFAALARVVCLDRDWPLIAAESSRAERPAGQEAPESLAVVARVAVAGVSGLAGGPAASETAGAAEPTGLMLSHAAVAFGPLPPGLDAATTATLATLAGLRSDTRLTIGPGTSGTVTAGESPVQVRGAAFVLDRRLQPVPAGGRGELWLAGPGLPRGFLGRPELTAERFLPHPWSGEPGARLFRTGERARRDACGAIEICPPEVGR